MKMTKERYETLSLTDLRSLAKVRGMKKCSTLKKAELIERMLMEDTKPAEEAPKNEASSSAASSETGSEPEKKENHAVPEEKQDASKEKQKKEHGQTRRSGTNTGRGGRRKKAAEVNGAAPSDRTSGVELAEENASAEQHNSEATGTEKTTVAEKKTAEKNLVDMPEAPKTAEGTSVREAASVNRKSKAAGKDSESKERKENSGRKPRGRRPAKTLKEADKPVKAAEETSGKTAEEREPASSESDDKKVSVTETEARSAEADDTEKNTPEASAENNRTEAPASVKETEPAPAEAVKPQREQKKVKGILEVMQDGYGFLRLDNFMPGENDIYVSPSQIRRFALKTGDMLTGPVRARAQGEKFGALLYVESVNDLAPEESRRRASFESMTPTFPCERIRLERADGAIATRIVDLISPIGKGQRGMIVSPPKAGKTTLLKDIATSILRRNPEAYLMILLIDERPEEVTDMKESVGGTNVEIIYSTFDEMPDHHRRVSEMTIERAKRLVEHKKDVIILLDSITRLARAYNVLVPPSGRTLSGGLDPTALYMPKRFFGAARNMREGGSLTILATALVDTGSKMDDVVYEEFKGTGNMELILDRRLQERRIFPAIDIVKSGTRREDLLLTQTELEAVNRMRRSMNGMKSDEAVEAILRAFTMTRTNSEIVNAVLSGRLG